MFIRGLRYELEGEPDGGTAVMDPPAVATPTPQEPTGDPAQPAPASTDATPPIAPAVDGAAPSSDSAAPATDAAQPRVTPEELRALAVAYREELRQIPEIREEIAREAQAGADRTIQQFLASPAADETYRELETRAGASAQRLAETLGRLNAGEIDLDDTTARTISADTANVIAYRTDQERRAQYHGLDTRISQSVADAIAGNLDGLDPGLLDLAEQQSAEARDLYERMSKATDREGRPDERTRRQAKAVYDDRMLTAHANVWLAEGMRRAARTFEAQRQADLVIARENARREAEAAQQAGGIPPNPDANWQSAPTGPLTAEAAATMPIEQLVALRARQETGA